MINKSRRGGGSTMSEPYICDRALLRVTEQMCLFSMPERYDAFRLRESGPVPGSQGAWKRDKMVCLGWHVPHWTQSHSAIPRASRSTTVTKVTSEIKKARGQLKQQLTFSYGTNQTKVIWCYVDNFVRKKKMFSICASHHTQNYFEMNCRSEGRKIFLSWDKGSIHHTRIWYLVLHPS